MRKLRGNQPLQPRAVILTGPGEESQVDYGTGAMVRDPQTRKYRRTRLFVMVLGCSRKAARFLTFRSSSRIWAELHEKAFRRLGGATRVVVLDNLREGVLVPDIYDPTLNPLYRDVLAHYGAVALPCRIKDPDRKGKVESGVGHAQRALQGKRFESLEEAQAYLDRWETSCADTRIHGTTKRQVAAMFAEEKPALLPLPLEPFRYYQHGKRGVNLDGCVEVDAAYYGLPPCTTANGCFKKVNQDDEQGNYPIANPQWNPEEALDVEMVSAICPKCHILLVEANSADEANVAATPVTHSDLGAAVDTAVNLGDGKVYVFKGHEYIRYDIASGKAEGGYPRPIAPDWPGLMPLIDWVNWSTRPPDHALMVCLPL